MAGFWKQALGATALLWASHIEAASLDWRESTPGNFDYGKQLTLPDGFGDASFTLEIWIRPNQNFPVGSTQGGGQLTNWSNANVAPYSSPDWWFLGNFLLDGHNNLGGNFQNGTFSLQLYDGGRVRWLFGDGSSQIPSGNLWAIPNRTQDNGPRLLDGNWHHVALVRRCTNGSSPATLELWIDGVQVDTETTTSCPNMATAFWNNWTGYPNGEEGWFWGAEKQAALGSSWEDYKGLIDELRFWSSAKSPTQLSNNWQAAVTGSEPGLVGWYPFNGTSGTSACSSIVTSQCMSLHNTSNQNWSTVEAPPVGGTPDTTLPSIPQNLIATAMSSSSIMLTWADSTDNVGVTSYQIRRDGNVAGAAASATFNSIGLTPNTTYSFTVEAMDAAGNLSGQSSAASATTLVAVPDTTVPTLPTSLVATATSSSNISLTWIASTDNVGVTGYEVRRNGVVIGSPTGTSFNDGGRSASTTYNYEVRALDAAGNVSNAATASATTPAAPSSSSSSGGGGGGGGRLDLATLLLGLSLLAIEIRRRTRKIRIDRTH